MAPKDSSRLGSDHAYLRRRRRRRFFAEVGGVVHVLHSLAMHVDPTGQQTEPLTVRHTVVHSRQIVAVQNPDAQAFELPAVQAVPF